MSTKLSSATLTARYQAVRDFTEALSAPISPEEQTVQSMPDASPTKWHRGHTSWFFETFLLRPSLAGYKVFDDEYSFLFNSYYNAVGERLTRANRGILGRPSAATVGEYRRHVDEAMGSLLASDVVERLEVVDLIELGIHHEQQHQELLLMDIKYTLSQNPLRPGYREGSLPVTPVAPLEWLDVTGGIFSIGHNGDGFSFDNELPRYEVLLDPFQIASRPVTNGDWLEFIGAGGYQRTELWLSDGWATCQTNGWAHPEYWIPGDDGWRQFTLNGPLRLDRNEPVSHVSFFEADAYARWVGARLPTEFEWECAVRRLNPDGPDNKANSVETDRLHPGGPNDGLRFYGDVWEWSASPYVGYPGFKAAEGAVGEYNGKFMVNQQVLRGGCSLTPLSHMRLSYRNFFPAHTRWQSSGLRLAR